MDGSAVGTQAALAGGGVVSMAEVAAASAEMPTFQAAVRRSAAGSCPAGGRACAAAEATRCLAEKLDWLRSFAVELAAWRECQQVVDAGLRFINEQGLSRGAAQRLHAALDATAQDAASRPLADRLVEFVAAAETKLQPGERLPMSTEILESSFALCKQREGQHSHGGFTSLLACFAALLQPTTEESVRHAFARVSVKRVREWTKTNLGTTLTSKRQTLYTEFRRATKTITATQAFHQARPGVGFGACFQPVTSSNNDERSMS